MARKQAMQATNLHAGGEFPPEAYAYDDDVTAEAVEKIRQQAKKQIDAETWSVVDGFGRVIHP